MVNLQPLISICTHKETHTHTRVCVFLDSFVLCSGVFLHIYLCTTYMSGAHRGQKCIGSPRMGVKSDCDLSYKC